MDKTFQISSDNNQSKKLEILVHPDDITETGNFEFLSSSAMEIKIN